MEKFKVVYIPYGDTGGFPRRHWEICTDEKHPLNVICFDGDHRTIKKMVKLWNKRKEK